MKVCLVLVLSVVVLLIAITIFYIAMSNKKKEKFENNEPSLKVMLFYATWCPHCEHYLQGGKFDTFEKAVVDAGVTDKVVFAKYDYDKNKALGDKYNISGFPSIIAENKEGKVFSFNGNRDSAGDIVKFVKSSLAGTTLKKTDY